MLKNYAEITSVTKTDNIENNIIDYSKFNLAELRAKVVDLVTEDDEPVDSIYSERQQRLLVEALYSFNGQNEKKQSFVALSNVGLFYSIDEPPIVPDMLLSLNVRLPDNVMVKHNRSYFIWEYGKAPEVVIEIVSNTKGSEKIKKFNIYACIGINNYVVFDPENRLKEDLVQVYQLHKGKYRQLDNWYFPEVGLGLMLWYGQYEGMTATWLRWCNADGQMLLTGSESARLKHFEVKIERQRADDEKKRADDERKCADDERKRADNERKRADDERQRADDEKKRADDKQKRAERYAEMLRKLGVDLNEL
jgi:Uma2 family endonuclease